MLAKRDDVMLMLMRMRTQTFPLTACHFSARNMMNKNKYKNMMVKTSQEVENEFQQQQWQTYCFISIRHCQHRRRRRHHQHPSQRWKAKLTMLRTYKGVNFWYYFCNAEWPWRLLIKEFCDIILKTLEQKWVHGQ